MRHPRHRYRWSWYLDKWYLDTVTPAGDVLVLLLARIRLFGRWWGRVTADLYRLGREPVGGDAPATGVGIAADRVRFGPASIQGDQVRWETPGLSGTLRYTPRHPAVTLRDPFVTVGRRALAWTVEVPDADVRGEVRWPGGTLAVEGRGYRDRVWGDLPPWRIPIRALRWGRAVAGSHCATWIEADLRNGRIRERWADGARAGEPFALPELSDSRTLSDSRIADIAGLRLGTLRPVLRRLSRDPRQTRWAARALLCGESGWALHEEVRWR